jgi:quercetin dioxygenase-like cupin family protein
MREDTIMWLNRRRVGALGGMLTLAALAGAYAVHTGLADTPAAKGSSVAPVFAYDLPNLPGQTMTGVLVEYAPGASSPPHHHTAEGSVVAYVLEGAIRSKVNDGPERVYQAGESWLEPPGAAHSVSANASATEPARLLAVFVADHGAELTTFDE